MFVARSAASAALVVAGLAAASLSLAAIQPAAARDDGVGTLTCRAYGAPVPVGARQPVRCVLVSNAGGVRESYSGRVFVTPDNAAHVYRPMTRTVDVSRYDAGMLVGRTIVIEPEAPVDRGVSMSTRLVITGSGGTDELVDRSWAPGPPASDIPSR